MENYERLRKTQFMPIFITHDLDQCSDLFLLNDKRRLLATIILRCIYGVDLDERAIDVAKLNIWLKSIVLAPEEFKIDNIPSDSQHVLPNLELNFFVGDSINSLPEKDIISHLSLKQSEIITLWNERESYIHDYQNRDPLTLRQTIDSIKNELDHKYSAFLEKENLGFIRVVISHFTFGIATLKNDCR